MGNFIDWNFTMTVLGMQMVFDLQYNGYNTTVSLSYYGVVASNWRVPWCGGVIFVVCSINVQNGVCAGDF